MPEEAIANDRLQRLEDLEEIRQLFVDYGHHLDHGQFGQYAALFADEGEVLLGPVGRAKGPEAIEELLRRTLEGSVGRSYHLISSPRIELEGDQATAEVMWTVVARGKDDRPQVSMIGRHRDSLVRRDGRWRFLRRAGHVDIPGRYDG